MRALLEDLLSKNPQDQSVAAELARLKAGKRLRCTENEKERGIREGKEAHYAIAHLLEKWPIGEAFDTVTTSELRSLQRVLRDHISTLKRRKTPAPPGTSALLSKLACELKQRRRKTSNWTRRVIVVLIFIAIITSCVVLVLRERASSLSIRLENAMEANEWDRTQSLLDAVDTGINHLLLPSVISLTRRARAWQQQVLASFHELSRRLEVYKRLHAVSTLSVEERGSFLRTIRKLPMPYSGKLLAEWDALCRPEQVTLERQKEEIISRISRARRTPTLTGDPLSDREALLSLRKELVKICDEFDDARETFTLDPLLILPLREEMETVNALLHDIEAFHRITVLVSTARNYEEYLKGVKGFVPGAYNPAQAVANTLRHLPEPTTMLEQLRAVRHGLPTSIPPHIIRALLQNGPSFGPALPANQRHLQLMEDVFTSATLRRPVYTVDTHDGRTFYTEKAPKMEQDGSVSFELSTMDPTVHTASAMTLKSFAYAGSRLLNAAPILDATGIDRSTFFLQANVPKLLGVLTSSKLDATPALARAYLYSTLMEVLHNLPEQEKLCHTFSPALKEDSDSFHALCRRLEFPLNVTCWLSHSPHAGQSEKSFSEWFRQHANRPYTEEIRCNFSAILKEPAGYIGYVDTTGTPHFKDSPPPPGKTLRYFSDGKLVDSPAGSPLRSPAPLSPIFVD